MQKEATGYVEGKPKETDHQEVFCEIGQLGLGPAIKQYLKVNELPLQIHLVTDNATCAHQTLRITSLKNSAL